MSVKWVLLFFLLPLVAADSEPESLRWIDHTQLSYSDFKGKVPAATSWAAITSSAINFYHSTSNGFVTDVEVFATFEPYSSWMKGENEIVLQHEQLHFDITEVYARKFLIQLKKLVVIHQHTDKKAHALFKQMNDACKSFQQQYDSQTAHGTNMHMQLTWSEKVAALLRETAPYSASSN